MSIPTGWYGAHARPDVSTLSRGQGRARVARSGWEDAAMSSAAQAQRLRVGAGGVVLLCLAIAGVEGYDIQSFGIAATRLAPDLGLDPARLGLAASAAMMGLTLGAVVGGWISDRIGRKPVLLASIALFGL